MTIQLLHPDEVVELIEITTKIQKLLATIRAKEEIAAHMNESHRRRRLHDVSELLESASNEIYLAKLKEYVPED